MPIQCKTCGAELPKDGARFCNKCGTLVPSHPLSPQSLSAAKNDSQIPFSPPPADQQEAHNPPLREQVAHHLPPTGSEGSSGQDMLPESSDQDGQKEVDLEMLDTNELPQVQAIPQETPPEELPETPQPEPEEDSPSPAKEVSSEHISPPASSRNIAEVRSRLSRSTQVPRQTPVGPAPVTYMSLKEPSTPQKDRADRPIATAIEDLPTTSIAVPAKDLPPAQEDSVEDLPTTSIAVPPESHPPLQEDSVDMLPTTPIASVPRAQSVTQEKSEPDQSTQPGAVSSPSNPSLSPTDTIDAPPSTSDPAGISSTITPKKENDPLAFPTGQSRRRWPLLVANLLLIMLVIGVIVGVGAVIYQPGGQDTIVQPQVSFSDTHLGLSLLYPNGWTKQVGADTSTVHFYASNHTGQVDIITANSSGSVNQALQQQVTKIGMSGTKARASLRFAGATWQQRQGTLQQSGANYTDTLLATIHGGQTFIIVQQAPQSNYGDWENEFFAPLRQSFKFL